MSRVAVSSALVSTPVHPKCTVCGLTVYSEELVKTGVRDSNDIPYSYHQSCFKCCHCGSVLQLSSFAQEKGKVYCIQHYKEIFGRKGGYDQLEAEKIDHIATPPIVTPSPTLVSKPCAFVGCSKTRIGGSGPNFHYCAEHAQNKAPDNAPPAGYTGHIEKGKKPGKTFGGGGTKCTACGKTAYENESIKTGVSNFVYHTACFKCSECKSMLAIHRFAQNEGRLYCPDHFTQIVQRKGHYEGI